jgi:hypothetical protein
MLMTIMVKLVRHQTTLDIKVELAFVTMVGRAITSATTSITLKKFHINKKSALGVLSLENEGMLMKWV